MHRLGSRDQGRIHHVWIPPAVLEREGQADRNHRPTRDTESRWSPQGKAPRAPCGTGDPVSNSVCGEGRLFERSLRPSAAKDVYLFFFYPTQPKGGRPRIRVISCFGRGHLGPTRHASERFNHRWFAPPAGSGPAGHTPNVVTLGSTGASRSPGWLRRVRRVCGRFFFF